MRTVRISERAARALLAELPPRGQAVMSGHPLARALAELESALSRLKSPKRVASKKATRTRKTEAAKTKRGETAAIHTNVFNRARLNSGYPSHPTCEFCEGDWATEMHHVFGRVRVQQSERNCIAVCRICHELLTNPKHAADNWTRMADVLADLGFHEEASEAARLAGKAMNKAALDRAREELGRESHV